MDANIKRATGQIVEVSELVKSVDVPVVFTNSFQCGFTFSDSHIVFKTHDVPTVVVNMGLPAMKSLYNQLGSVLETYNRSTGQTVMSLEEIADFFNNNKNV